MKKEAIIVPEGCREVLLHACCAPCSSAIVEWMLAHDVRPTIFYYNPNIFPLEEYEIHLITRVSAMLRASVSGGSMATTTTTIGWRASAVWRESPKGADAASNALRFD